MFRPETLLCADGDGERSGRYRRDPVLALERGGAGPSSFSSNFDSNAEPKALTRPTASRSAEAAVDVRSIETTLCVSSGTGDPGRTPDGRTSRPARASGIAGPVGD